mgnify:CR=1 FL=1
MATTIHDVETRRRISGGGLRTWFNIAADWQLTDRQAARLLGAPISTYRRWKTKPDTTLDIGQIERLSLLLARLSPITNNLFVGIIRGPKLSLFHRASYKVRWVR